MQDLSMRIALLVLIVLLLVPVSSLAQPEQRSVEVPQSIERNVRFSFTVTNTKSGVIPGADFWFHVPVAETAFQEAQGIEISQPYEIETDITGNQVVHISLVDIPPYGNVVVQAGARMKMRHPGKVPVTDTVSRFLASQPYIESDNPKMMELARELQGRDVLETLRYNYSWVIRNLIYEGYIRNPRGALYALKEKKGDCTEYAALYVALCRAIGIPARVASGFVCDADCVFRPSEHHDWAEVLVDGSWRIVDPQRKNFMERESEYITMKVIDNASYNMLTTNWSSLFGVDDGLTVQMN